jgi:AraC-like DNA-binding protein/tetratricopeptide (TPR) repeat protein
MIRHKGGKLAQSALPHDVRKALDLLEADPGRELGIKALAAACGVAPRTLQKHFRRFVGRSPHEVQWALRMERARRDLLTGPPDASVTDIALRWGFRHLGRFAVLYRRRYDESPSATLRHRRSVLGRGRVPASVQLGAERPLVGVLPFTFTGPDARRAAVIVEEIAAALSCKRWLAIVPPASARYRLRGTIQADVAGRLRAVTMLIDISTGRYIWAERWDGELEDSFAFQERVATSLASAIERSVRDAEIVLAGQKSAEELNAWQLTMKAFPFALSIEAQALARALELLERAMELAPNDALPPAFAAWCHGQRGGHYFTARPAVEKQKARELAARATRLNSGDPVVEALAGAAYTLAHDLAPASHHFDRALALDGACVWAWNRSGWISVYRGNAAEAIERFQIARTIAPDDPLNFFCTIGIAASHFEAGHYDESARWFTRGLAEHPSAVWVNRFRAPACALAGRKDEARQSFAELATLYPDLTISQVRSALPNTPSFLDRQAEGLEALGMRP